MARPTQRQISRGSAARFVASKGLQPPVAYTPPSLSGNVGVGQIVAVNSGLYSGAPTKVRTVLLRDGVEIPGTANLTAYTIVAADVGARLGVAERVANSKGYLGNRGPATPIVPASGSTAIPAVPIVQPPTGGVTDPGTPTPETAFLGTTGYRFASTRFRPSINMGAVAAGLEYRLDRTEFYSPPFVAREFMFGIPSHWTRADGVTPSEAAMPNPVNFEGIKCHAFISGSWVSVPVTVTDPSVPYNGASAFTLDPAVNDVGTLVACAFGVDVPPGTRMLIALASNVAAGGSMITGLAPTAATGRLDACTSGASSFLTSIDLTSAIGGDARIGGGMFSPSFCVAKPKNGLTARVFWAIHDSKGWGRNMLERYLDTPLLSCGFIAMAMDESTIGPRAACGMTGVPSVGAAEWKVRTGWNRKLDLIKKLPNRPYTDILTDHYNNGNILDANYRTSFYQYYDLLLGESRNWGDANAKLHQTRPIPSPSSTDFVTTLAGQTLTGGGSLSSTRFAGFDADLLANYWPQVTSIVNTNRDYAYDQGSNRDKVKLTGKSYSLASAYTAGATSMSVNEQPTLYEQLVIDPTVNTGATYIRAISGTGPWTLTLFPGVNKARAAGDLVPTTLVGDRIGLHPANQGHATIAPVVAEWKTSRLAV